MKIRKFNENWQENAFSRKDKYMDLLNNVLDAIKEKTSEWMQDNEYHYTSEMYDLLTSLIENLDRFSDDDFYKLYKKELEEINNQQ